MNDDPEKDDDATEPGNEPDDEDVDDGEGPPRPLAAAEKRAYAIAAMVWVLFAVAVWWVGRTERVIEDRYEQLARRDAGVVRPLVLPDAGEADAPTIALAERGVVVFGGRVERAPGVAVRPGDPCAVIVDTAATTPRLFIVSLSIVCKGTEVFRAEGETAGAEVERAIVEIADTVGGASRYELAWIDHRTTAGSHLDLRSSDARTAVLKQDDSAVPALVLSLEGWSFARRGLPLEAASVTASARTHFRGAWTGTVSEVAGARGPLRLGARCEVALTPLVDINSTCELAVACNGRTLYGDPPHGRKVCDDGAVTLRDDAPSGLDDSPRLTLDRSALRLELDDETPETWGATLTLAPRACTLARGWSGIAVGDRGTQEPVSSFDLTNATVDCSRRTVSVPREGSPPLVGELAANDQLLVFTSAERATILFAN